MNALVRAGLLAAALALAPAHAAVTTTTEAAIVAAGAPGTFTFTVSGWTGGGTVTGSFEGTDVDGSGQLSSFAGEITAFSMSYSGGAIVGAIALDFADLFGLVYDLDGGVLGDGLTLDVEGIGATSGVASFVLGPGPLARCDGEAICGTISGPSALVPEPSALLLVLAGIAALLRRRGSV